MTQIITTDSALPEEIGGLFSASSLKAIFSRTRFQANSDMLVHVPLLSWITGILRPSRSGVIGVGDGVAHFSICQTLDKLNLDGRCIGYGFWSSGNDDNAKNHAPSGLSDHSHDFYEDISILRCADGCRSALNDIAPKSLDLLFVDLRNLPESELPQLGELQQCLRANGTLILHGTHGQAVSNSAITGLVRTLTDLSRVEFDVGNGLTILPSREASLPPRFQALLDICVDGVMPNEIELIFRRLGEGTNATIFRRLATEQIAQLQEDLKSAQEKQSELQAKLLNRTEELDGRNQMVWKYQAALFDRERELSETNLAKDEALRDITRHNEEMTTYKDEILRVNEELVRQSAVVESQRMEMAALKTQTQKTDQAEHDNNLRQMRLQINSVQVENGSLRDQLNREKSVHYRETATLTNALEKERRRGDALMSSTSWKITAPIRKMKSTFTGK